MLLSTNLSLSGRILQTLIHCMYISFAVFLTVCVVFLSNSAAVIHIDDENYDQESPEPSDDEPQEKKNPGKTPNLKALESGL